ncbi:MAG: hypothetical protein WCS42_06080 [Verrucomicrobiota bacterium]
MVICMPVDNYFSTYWLQLSINIGRGDFFRHRFITLFTNLLRTAQARRIVGMA